jgi:bifunctional non-homologous end joining protein LigD
MRSVQARPKNEAHVRHPRRTPSQSVQIPRDSTAATLTIAGHSVTLTNLTKVFWPPAVLKRDLLQYYADVSPFLLPHLRNRAMVMKRYPDGAMGKFFFMKRAPQPRPEWVQTCSIEHPSGSIIDFPVVGDLPSLLWLVNLGCIDLNPWYATCDDVNRPDALYFDLDPGGATFSDVCETALVVREALKKLHMPCFAKTTGSKGIHVAVPIVRGPIQKEVWSFAKSLAQALATEYPKLITAEYRVQKRPKGRVLVDYNQNAWGRTLASIYSLRPRCVPTVSAPVTWTEIEKGIRIEDFRIDNMLERLERVGDLWKPLLAKRGRYDLRAVLSQAAYQHA